MHLYVLFPSSSSHGFLPPLQSSINIQALSSRSSSHVQGTKLLSVAVQLYPYHGVYIFFSSFVLATRVKQTTGSAIWLCLLIIDLCAAEIFISFITSLRKFRTILDKAYSRHLMSQRSHRLSLPADTPASSLFPRTIKQQGRANAPAP